MEMSEQATFLSQPWWKMGEPRPGTSGLWVNETATRARAGLLNAISGATLLLLWLKPELDPVRYAAPFVIFDMLAGVFFGLTPFSPAGVAGTLISRRLPAVWKPNKPKRFAWFLGALMGAGCLGFWLADIRVGMFAVLGTCFALTWLEAVLGFCVGCWMYGLFWGCGDCEVEA